MPRSLHAAIAVYALALASSEADAERWGWSITAYLVFAVHVIAAYKDPDQETEERR